VKQSIRRLDLLPHELKAWWYARSGVARLFLVGSIGLLAALFVSSVTSWSNAYSMRSRTAVVTVEPSCGRSLVWDLPAGAFVDTSSDTPPPLTESAPVPQPTTGVASVHLVAGARARIERIGDGELAIHLERSPHFIGCATADALIEVRINGQRTPGRAAQRLAIGRARGGTDRIVYRSTAEPPGSKPAPVASATGEATMVEFVLPLEGRIVVGAELQHGAGWRDSGPPPLLDSADIQVRSLEGITGHSVALVEERVDAGGIVDSTPCFDLGPSLLDKARLLFEEPALALDPGARRHEACTRAMRSPALGFVRAHREGGMEAQVHVQAQHLAITSHQGQPRLLAVTLWQSLTHWHLVQALVAFVVLLGSAKTAIEMIYKIHAAAADEDHAKRTNPVPRPRQTRLKPTRRPLE
jgi:hypothetical protein